MSEKPIQSKPSTEHRRRAVAARRLGKKVKCTRCGETRPEALIRGSKPRICAACQRESQGESETDLHHLGGENNHCGTIPVPVNDHRARLSLAQYKWPSKTLRNPDGSPLLAIAACIRGFIDFVEYCVDEFLRWAAGVLERLDVYLVEKLGPRWWVGIIEQLTNEGHANEQP
jgi:hypothetical protein